MASKYRKKVFIGKCFAAFKREYIRKKQEILPAVAAILQDRRMIRFMSPCRMGNVVEL